MSAMSALSIIARWHDAGRDKRAKGRSAQMQERNHQRHRRQAQERTRPHHYLPSRQARQINHRPAARYLSSKALVSFLCAPGG